jgi:hypothetical protein
VKTKFYIATIVFLAGVMVIHGLIWLEQAKAQTAACYVESYPNGNVRLGDVIYPKTETGWHDPIQNKEVNTFNFKAEWVDSASSTDGSIK